MSEDIAEKVRVVIAENFGDTGAVEDQDIHGLIDEIEYQRRHRRWALQEAEMQLMRVKIWRGGW